MSYIVKEDPIPSPPPTSLGLGFVTLEQKRKSLNECSKDRKGVFP